MSTTTEQQFWLAERQKGIGGSDAPVVLDLSPWKSRFQLWAEKCGHLPPDDLSDNEAVEFGNRLERVVLEAYQDRLDERNSGHECALLTRYSVYQHPDHPWMKCTPDALRDDGAIIQIKTASAWKDKDWQDEPPLMYQVQVQHEMAVVGADMSVLVALIGGQKLRWFDVPRNDKFIAALITAEEKFWRLVQEGIEPEPDDTRACADVLRRLHPHDDGASISLPTDADQWDARLVDVKEQIKALESEKTQLENRIKAAIGDATYGITMSGVTYSWKSSQRAGYTVEPTTTRTLRRMK